MASEDEFQTQKLTPRISRRVYLITYSQADLTKFPTREKFGEAVKKGFDHSSGKVKVEHWACSLENHQIRGVHYHLSIKLSGVKRWKKVKDSFIEKYGVVLHFSDNHDNYYSAYKYISKSDDQVFHSEGHPNLRDASSPKTKKLTQALRKKRRAAVSTKETHESSERNNTEKKPKRLSNVEVSNFIISNNVHSDIELMALANSRKMEGQNDLTYFVLSKTSKSLNDLLEMSWKMHNASNILARKNIKRIDLLRNSLNGECVLGCNELWYEKATEVLDNNHINRYVYAAALRDLMNLGRGKFRNILLVGPANTGKTFLLKPLESIFHSFVNPATDKYAWVGCESAEVILLQDFRWVPELIA